MSPLLLSIHQKRENLSINSPWLKQSMGQRVVAASTGAGNSLSTPWVQSCGKFLVHFHLIFPEWNTSSSKRFKFGFSQHQLLKVLSGPSTNKRHHWPDSHTVARRHTWEWNLAQARVCGNDPPSCAATRPNIFQPENSVMKMKTKFFMKSTKMLPNPTIGASRFNTLNEQQLDLQEVCSTEDPRQSGRASVKGPTHGTTSGIWLTSNSRHQRADGGTGLSHFVAHHWVSHIAKDRDDIRVYLFMQWCKSWLQLNCYFGNESSMAKSKRGTGHAGTKINHVQKFTEIEKSVTKSLALRMTGQVKDRHNGRHTSIQHSDLREPSNVRREVQQTNHLLTRGYLSQAYVLSPGQNIQHNRNMITQIGSFPIGGKQIFHLTSISPWDIHCYTERPKIG